MKGLFKGSSATTTGHGLLLFFAFFFSLNCVQLSSDQTVDKLLQDSSTVLVFVCLNP